MEHKRITVIPGDGIGPEIMVSTLKVLDHLQCGFEYDFADAGLLALVERNEFLPKETLFLIKKNGVVLKGPITNSMADDFSLADISLCKMFNLYANVRPAASLAESKIGFKKFDIIAIRENIYKKYSDGVERLGAADSISVITRVGIERVIRFAFGIARKFNRKKITFIYKADLLKTSSELFLHAARDVANEFEGVQWQEMAMDRCSVELTSSPENFDVIVTDDLVEDVVFNVCAELTGGLCMAPVAHIGEEVSIFETVHGSALDIVGKKIANPAALMLAAAMMLDHLRMPSRAQRLRRAIGDVIAAHDRVTCDLGGTGTTDDFAQAVIERL